MTEVSIDLKSWFYDVICLSNKKMKDIYGNLPDNISSQSGHQGCIVKKVRKLCFNEN